MSNNDAPSFHKPDYGFSGHTDHTGDESVPPRLTNSYRDSGAGEPAAQSKRNETLENNVTPEPSADDEEKDLKTAQTHSNNGEAHHHLRFTETAKHAAEGARRRLHIHREHTRGPSEARQRRQSSIRTVGTVEEIRLPFHKRFLYGVREVIVGIWTMLTTFAYWDMAFWSGWSYTWGSVLFIIDGAWAWTPLQWPSSEFSGESKYGVSLLFLFGALLYQVGATMAYLEAINDGSFAGPAMKRLLEGHEDDQKRLLDDKLHAFFGHMVIHHHKDDDDKGSRLDKDLERQENLDSCEGWASKDKGELPEGVDSAPRRGGMDAGPADEGNSPEYLTWRWWPTWHSLKTYHIKQVGYVACVIQLLGATLYAICGVIVLPGILSKFTPGQAIGGYWVPQTVASVCFLTAGILFTYETQERWNRPLPGRIAWWIGVWATVGSIGFLLSASFGIRSNDYSWCEYQSSLASMWGSFAYFLSSVLQWYESINKGPVLAFPNNRIPSVMR